MEEKSMDRRVRHTRQRLREALLELMKEKKISEISPTELCRQADINRNTFYAHFSRPGELLVSIEQELCDEMSASIQHSLDVESAHDLILEICEWIYRNREVYEILLSGKGDATFSERILYLAREKSIEEWKKTAPSLSARQLDNLYLYIANGAAAVINAWIQRVEDESPLHIADFIERVSMRGLRAFLDEGGP
jgi:AcrR family transcriptional regulator